MVTAAIFVLINKILTIMMVGPTYTVPIRIQALAVIADTILIFVNKASRSEEHTSELQSLYS